ncbi:hypothetical protein L6164_017841 [Bauhinia variegata]|uniref:Uncharacterized protein n=1 Tax=Bauhinia variegata TaxID=167791 RepID=A0ACB9N971_BAUVA|nr:hypothetical protein L6164_017841 [Bauhinia variegata]
MEESALQQENLDMADCFEKLSDDLLLHILSFLPTKCAVRTSILSKRWKSLWTLLPNLDFDDEEILSTGMSFADAVNKVLILRNGSRIRNFRLSFSRSYFERHHVLNLMSLRYFSDDSFEELLSGCPVLEELFLNGVTYMRALKICVPTLKKLDVEFVNIVKVTKVEINAPSLESLYICDINHSEYLIKNLNKVLQASLSLWKPLSDTDCIFKILNALPSVESLTLTHWTTKSLLGVAHLDLPEFNKLVYLRFDLISLNWHFLTTLLQKSPNLEVLVIQRTPRGSEWDPTLVPSFSLGEESCWTEPSSVPVCVSSHLIKFEFRGFQGLEAAAELEFVRYVLENSNVLNKVTIQPSDLMNLGQRDGLRGNLSMLPRGSKTRLEFEQRDIQRV